MRGLTILVAVVAALYSGYWFAARTAVDRGTAGLVDSLRADGWQVDYADLGTAGFPNRIDTTVTGLHLSRAGLGWDAPFFQVFALSYRPNQVIAVWPPEQVLNLPGGQFTVTSDGLRASASVAVDTALSLDQITAESGPLRIVAAAGWALALDHTLLAFRQSGPDPAGYDAFGEGLAITLPAPLVAALDPQGRLPATVERVRLDAGLVLDRPLDRHMGQGGATLTGLTLREASLVWGEVTLSASGALTFDAAGVPEGRITLSATQWDSLIAMAVAAGAMPATTAPTWAAMADTMARGTDRLEVPVTFSNGMMSVGFIPLGPAPRLFGG